MANYNKVILVGNLTRDPQLTYLPSQTPVVEFGLAVNRTWTGQNNQRREEVCFVDCRSYGKQAETINHYMSKGRQILIEGRLSFQQWQAQDGTKRSKHIVIVEGFQFLGAGPGAGPGAATGEEGQAAVGVKPPMRARGPQPAAPTGVEEEPAPEAMGPPDEDVSQAPKGDDIPF